MRFVSVIFRWGLAIALLATGLALAFALVGRSGPASLDLGDPIGLATRGQLVALAGRGPACTALLDRAGVRFTALSPHDGGAQCRYDDGVRLDAGGSNGLRFEPRGLGTSCAVAAALAMWEWDVVQPAALARFGSPVARIEHFGAYSCRRIYGRAEGAAWSEHSRARAIDIAGVVLADGRRIRVTRDWQGRGPEAGFLHDIRDGACRLFGTALSPDYNRAHHDHLHLDMAARGGFGGGVCR